MPWTSRLTRHNPILGWFVKNSSIFPAWVEKQVQTRIQSRHEKHTAAPRDFLDRFFDAASTATAPGYDIPLIIGWSMANIQAGADTTAIVLRTILYYVLKSPPIKKKLLEELQSRISTTQYHGKKASNLSISMYVSKKPSASIRSSE